MENYKTSICVVGRRIQTCEAVAESAARGQERLPGRVHRVEPQEYN